MNEEVKTDLRAFLMKQIEKFNANMSDQGGLGDHLFHPNIAAQMADAAICVLQSAVESQAYSEAERECD